jgi:DNA polymerase-1
MTQSERIKKILIIDGANNFLRCFAVIPTLTLNGEPNGGVLGFLSSLSYFCKIIQPDQVIVVWDGQGGSKKRRSVVSTYKQGRKPARLNRNYEFELDDLQKNQMYQRVRLGQYLNDLPVTQVTVDSIEADDVIAYLCKQHFPSDRKVIASNDKDFYQLLDSTTILFSPTKKVFKNWKDIYKEYRIHPKNFALVRAITGDSSDNLPGIKGIGLKNVLKYFPMFLLEEKLEAEQLFEHCKTDTKRYDRFLCNQKVIIDNLKIMQLDNPIISFVSIQKIKECLAQNVEFNETYCRIKMTEDGITNEINNYFFRQFRILSVKKTTN